MSAEWRRSVLVDLSSMATVEQLAQALTEVRQQLGEAQRLAQEAQRAGVQASMASTAQVDPRVMNKCPTFSGRDREWSEWSFIFESVAAMANRETVMESAFTGSAEKPIADLTPEMKLGAKRLYYFLVNTVQGKALTLVRSAEKHHDIAAGKRIKSEYQPDAAGRHTAMFMGIMQPGWDSRNPANFLDQLTEWERRIQEYEGDSLETFSDGRKIAVLASHAPESIRNVVRLAAGPAGGKFRVVRQNMSEFLQFGRVFDKDGRGVESESNSASATPMDVDAVGKGKGCFVCGRPCHAAKECKFNQPDKNTPAKFEGGCRTVARKITCGQTVGSV